MRKPIPLPEPYAPSPSHLSAESQQLWRELGPRYATTSARREVLCKAFEARDLADDCRRERVSLGLTSMTATTKAIHLNPLLKVEIQSRRDYVQFLKELGATVEPSILDGLL